MRSFSERGLDPRLLREEKEMLEEELVSRLRLLQTAEARPVASRCLKSLVVSVYSSGLRAEFTGSTKTTSHAYRSPLILTPATRQTTGRQ